MKHKTPTFFPVFILLLAIGCTYNSLEEPLNCSSFNLALALASKKDANCSQANGSLQLTASGGSGNYIFSINQGPPQTSNTFQGLSAGSYILEVKDKTCVSTLMVEVANQDGLNITVAATEAGCSTNDGSIKITTVGGSAPVTFSLNGGAFTSSSDYKNLANGNYNIVARDRSGCEVKQAINLKSGISYSTSVAGIIQTNCAIIGCHVAGAQPPNFSQLANVQNSAALVKARTGNKSMPPGRSLTQAEINSIACWVDDGALNN